MSAEKQVLCKRGELILNNTFNLPDLTGMRTQRQETVQIICALYCQAVCLAVSSRPEFDKLVVRIEADEQQ